MKTKQTIVCGVLAVILAITFAACPEEEDPGSKGDLQKWTAVSDSTFGTSGIYGIAYGNNRFVAGGDSGRMAYSADGESWTAVEDSTLDSYNINGIAYGNNRFVAVGSFGKMAYSANGESWTAVADSTFPNDYNTGYIYGIAYGNSRFVAVGSFGKMAYSADGESWTAVADSTIWDYTDSYGDTYTAVITTITYGNNRFVAVGTDGKMAYSTDGENWTAVSNSILTSQINGIAYGNNRFVAVGHDASGNFPNNTYIGKMAYSDNGENWTAVEDSTFGPSAIWGIAYGNNRFVAVGGQMNESGKIAYSADGVSWTAVEDSTFGIWIAAIAYGNNRFVAVGNSGSYPNYTGKMAYCDW
jgi:hypothetical protein